MPHKKNSITGEKLCGLARLLRGNCLAGLENVALWHERDISHSSVERVILPDSTIALDHMILAAEFEGVGTCWVAAYNPAILREALSLADDETVFSITPLGYPKPGFEKKGNKKRKAIEEVVDFL